METFDDLVKARQGEGKICGIVGVFGEVTAKHEKAFKELLIIDQLRGKDSTGVLSVKRHNINQVTIAKQVGGPDELMNDKRFDNCFMGQINVLIGHNRWKTKGDVTRKNAHPFEFDEVAGVHNGTLQNQWKLEDGNSFQVDSEALYNHINKKGARDALKTAQGAIALAWYNKVHGTVNLYRNKERTLYMVHTKDAKTVFFASEGWMLEGVLDRNGIEMNDFPFLLGEEFMLSIPVAQGSGAIGKTTVSKIEGPKGFPVNHNNTLVGHRGTNVSVTVKQGKDGTNEVSGQLSLVSSKDSKGEYTAPDAVRKELLTAQGKALTFEVGALGRTSNGADFRTLFCPVYPEQKFVVYIHTERTRNLLEDFNWVQGDVANYINSSGIGWRFVVSPHTLEGLIVEELGERVYKDAHGKELTKEAFEEKYPFCSFCNSDIDADNDHKFTKNHDILCDDCIKDPEILELAGV